MTGNDSLQVLARAYVAVALGGLKREPAVLSNDAQAQFRVAEWYDLARDSSADMGTIVAYLHLIAEVDAQYEWLTAAGYVFEPFGDDVPDPYNNRSENMQRDLAENKHLWVYDGGGDHPLLTRERNWKFRAVHDVFGHAARGFSFGRKGEFNAAREHSTMFSKDAWPALFTETHGQTSWFEFGPFSDLPRKDRPFATQKALAMPSFFWPIRWGE